MIRYAQQNRDSDSIEMGLLDDLQSRYSSLTVFVPLGEEFGNQIEQVGEHRKMQDIVWKCPKF